ncbi:MAG TPA: acylneuraminate cytidylyltransferase family protein [Gemmatimonadales bacterium]
MLQSRRILAVVPARGGSKGVRLKNIHPLDGIPLVAHVGRVLRQVPAVDRAVVSTDSDAIATEAVAAGIEAPFRRPESLSGDLISDQQVLQHALTTMEQLDGATYDIVLMLQPTSPLRRPAHVTAVLEKLVTEDWDAVWTVSPTDLKYHPLKQLTVQENGAMEYFDPRGSGIIARQQLGPVYHRNGAAYAVTRDCLLRQATLKGTRTGAVILTEPMVSIDTIDDFARVEQHLRGA